MKRVPIFQDKQGIAAVEFGLISSAFFIVMMGGFDFSHTFYMRSVLQGTVQKAARDSALPGNDSTAAQALIDQKIIDGVRDLNKTATTTISRRFYRTFSAASAALPEPRVSSDGNANGLCDNSETYTDTNGNGVWDKDGADAGQGGAQDVVVFKVDVAYPRMFPLAKLLGVTSDAKVSSTIVLQNQPYGPQGSYNATPLTRTCV